MKCPGCGANIMQDTERAILFCPYCGVSIPQEKNALDTGCGELAFGQDLSMYVRNKDVKRKEHGRWSVAIPFEGSDYVSPMELDRENTYEFVAWGNVCAKCGKPMKPISEDNLLCKKNSYGEIGEQTVLDCPKCREPLYIAERLMWD